MQPVGNSKKGPARDDLLDGDSLLVRPIPDQKVCFSLACQGINFHANKLWCNLFYLLDDIPMLFDGSFYLGLCRKFFTRKIMVAVIHNKIVIATTKDLELHFKDGCQRADDE